MNDDGLEERLSRLRPAEPPRDWLRRLAASEPPALSKRSWWRTAGSAIGWLPRPWPLAYAGLVSAWALIAVLRLLTLRLDPESTKRVPTPLADTKQDNSPEFAGTFAAERALLLAHNNPEQP